jgi:NAD(P)-dependent dehydrogenase (short-subunit alcohol dehydrogenase family)
MDDTRKVIAATDKAFGRVDVVINAAGITDRGTIWDTKPELFDAMMAVNVRAPYFIIQDALHVMKREKTKGTFVNIISMSGHGGQDFISAYCISKGALITLTKNTAFSVMRHQIRVNGLDSVCAVCKEPMYQWRNGRPDYFRPDGTIPNSFDMESVVFETTGLYATRTTHVLASKKRMNTENCHPFPVSKLEATDINTPEDFELAEIIWRGLNAER